MTNPYTAPPASPSNPAQRPAPRWARKRYALPALALAFFVGLGAGAGEDGTEPDAKPVAAKPAPAQTVTATATVTLSPEAAPAPTVTATRTIRTTTTVTARPPAAVDVDDSDTSGDTGADIYYANCSEVRAAGAAPIHRGEPGYASHLDRDDDGTACDT